VIETPGGWSIPATLRLSPRPAGASRRDGYGSDDIVPIGRSHPNPATQNNSVWFFAARDVRPLGEQSLDPGEDIEIVLAGLTEVEAMISGGRITHALVLTLRFPKKSWGRVYTFHF